MIELAEYDDILISDIPTAGCRTSPFYVSDLPCMIATLSDDGYIKVWPRDQADWHDGKLWFDRNASGTVIKKVDLPQ